MTFFDRVKVLPFIIAGFIAGYVVAALLSAFAYGMGSAIILSNIK